MLIVEIGKISGDSRFEHLAYHTIFSLLARVSGFLYRLLFQKFFRCQLSTGLVRDRYFSGSGSGSGSGLTFFGIGIGIGSGSGFSKFF